MLKKIKKVINNLLLDMAKENEQTFGKGSLDCCKINKKKDTK